MLEVLRRNATGWLAKILIGLLVLSFAVWGVADMVTGRSSTTVATVGGTPISAQEFQQTYQNQLNQYTRRFGRRLTPQEAKVLGVERQIVDQLINAAALDNHAKSLDLTLSDKAVVAAVQADPTFRGADGKFSPDRLNSLIQQAGFSQERFLVARKQDEVRGQLTEALLANVNPPKVLQEMLAAYQGETRVVRYFTLDPKTVKIGTPSGNDLKTTYDQNKSQFMTPEYRKADILMLTAADARKQTPVTEAELKEAYERDKTMFATPEQRRILQIAFKDEAAARKAREEILAGKPFEEVAKAQGAKPGDTNLGLLARNNMLDSKIADAAFALEKDKVSDVVKGQFATVLLIVKEIQPGKQPTYEEVKPQLQDRIARLKASEQIRKLRDSIDDNRLAGKTLKEIGEMLKITFHAVEAADKSGNNPDGKAVFTSPDLARLMQATFAGEVGVENEVIELSDNGYAWVNLIAVTPQKQKPFEAVRDDVKNLWEQTQRQKALKERADELVGKIKGGESLEAAAKSAGAEVKATLAFKRNESVPGLTATVASRAFALPPGTPATAETPEKDTRMVFLVSEAKLPEKPEEKDAKAVREALANQMRSGVIEEYVTRLRDKQGFTISQSTIDRTTGASALAGQ